MLLALYLSLYLSLEPGLPQGLLASEFSSLFISPGQTVPTPSSADHSVRKWTWKLGVDVGTMAGWGGVKV